MVDMVNGMPLLSGGFGALYHRVKASPVKPTGAARAIGIASFRQITRFLNLGPDMSLSTRCLAQSQQGQPWRWA